MTGHPVTIISKTGKRIDFPYDNRSAARIPHRRNPADPVASKGEIFDAMTIASTGGVQGLPAEREGVYYIVSRLIFHAMPHRNDLLVPDGAIRNKRGQVIAAKRFIRRVEEV